ncbi:hypothetical protein BDP27DRAFT_1436014 [Rhodocollybia butyracea]|uniref:Sacsin/Nov domain-containing protein n=1 Tax=Rhodocollybia butyracea TaxID=206335 RepID=A0A9P5TVP6_9AGAR|nr:hypothetical protein BDP27DRAFT_1436014 [Rhodocollybia butyracea]
MPISWRERVDTASAIKGILDSYPSNSILREILQNSDDAQATKQIFILDHRQHGDQSVIEDGLKRTQGPALLAVNNKVFTESDWEAVRTIHGSNKSADETKTGKYGLGIRACYHITDNIHILSGDRLVIFDPHEEFQKFKGGLSIQLSERDGYKDQMAAFSGAFPVLPDYLQSTVVRLPLRTEAEAQRSKIKSSVMKPSDISALYQGFIQNELSVALLFMKHVMSIELREIGADGTETLVAEVAILNTEVASVRSFIPDELARSESYRLNVVSMVANRNFSQTWRIVHHVMAAELVKAMMQGRLGYDVGDRLKNDKLSSHIALAIPLTGQGDPQDIQGRLFTLLPLPISTGLPLHIHGIFALTSDRQNLRNPEELGINNESRERLLVSWNQMIFEGLIPKIWASALFHILIEDDHVTDIWAAWPPSTARIGPMSDLLSLVAEEALTYCMHIFPAQKDGKCIFIGPDQPALVADASVEEELRHAVSLAGIAVVFPPSHIFTMLQRAAAFQDPHCGFKVFNAQNLFDHLNHELQITKLRQLEDISKDRILEYLICASPSYVLGLPLIPIAGCPDRISLVQPTYRTRRYTLAGSMEADLFCSCDPAMIALHHLGSKVCDVLRRDSTRDVLNVTELSPDILKGYLISLKLQPGYPGVTQFPLSWFHDFWNWIDRAHNSEEFFTILSPFHLLPMLDNTSRKVSDKAFILSLEQEELCTVLRMAGVPFLHPSVSSWGTMLATMLAHGVIVPIENVTELVGLVDPSGIQDGRSRLVLQEHLIQCIQIKRPILTVAQMMNYCSLPVFPTRIPKVPSPVTELNPVVLGNGRLLYINIPDENFPLPMIPNATFIDMSQSSRVLLLFDAQPHILTELDIMDLTVKNLTIQPQELQDALMQRIVPRLFDLTSETREKLKHQNFVPAVGTQRRVAPLDIIDPASTFANLFLGEPGRFPSPPYSQGVFLSMMKAANFYCSKLSPKLVHERIGYISSNSLADPSCFDKAKALLYLLSEADQWDPSFTEILQTEESVSWIPTTSSLSELLPRQHCRSGKLELEEHFLFDLVLAKVLCNVSENVRGALGWSLSLTFDVLEQQFQTIFDHPNNPGHPDRLLHLIKYISKQHSDGILTPRNLESLKNMGIGSTFFPIPTKLRYLDCANFLKEMGCSEQPTIESLVEALNKSSTALEERLLLLSELSSHGSDITSSQRECVLVPASDDSEASITKLTQVYYNDIGDLSTSVVLQDSSVLLPLHPAISKMVAAGLGIPFLSSLRLDEDSDIDDDDMAESLVTRIQHVLRDYDIEYSFNEFLANAIDAGASCFRVLLDAQIFGTARILCPEMGIFQSRPAMILFNDSTFSQEDFKGIRHVGEGGKQTKAGTIGKFGLGALSFYQFSDIAFIISKENIMILDPSAGYLPKRKGYIPRRSIFRKLKDFRRQYAGHLEPLDGLFGFSATMDSYPGTLIRLPLRTAKGRLLLGSAMSLADCRALIRGMYQILARTALFFTPKLNTITALERLGNGQLASHWEIKGQRSRNPCLAEDNVEESCLQIHHEDVTSGKESQAWLIIKDLIPMSQVPPEFIGVVQQLKATDGIEISLAFDLDYDHRKPKWDGRLFAGLQLPELISLPVHINATFSISSDRRGIRFDPRTTVIGVLYSLEPLHQQITSQECYRLVASTLQGIISETVLRAFYASLTKVNTGIFPGVTGTLVAPSDAILSSDETEHVRKLLLLLEISKYVVLPTRVMSLLKKHSANALPVLTVESLSSVLRVPGIDQRLQDLFDNAHPHPQDQVISMIDATIAYLINGKSPDGHTLRLLVTRDLVLRRFDESDSPVYDFNNHSFPDDLFPASKFISSNFRCETRRLLTCSPTYNVQEFNGVAVLKFMKEMVGNPCNATCHSPKAILWINLFWRHFQEKSLPEDLKLEHLDSYPLFPTFQRQEFVSLTSCISGSVLPNPSSGVTGVIQSDQQHQHNCKLLRNIMSDLGIAVVRAHPMLARYESMKFSFKTFLQCLLQNGENPFEELDSAKAGWLASWIVKQPEMTYGITQLSKLHLDFLASLPLWESTNNGTFQRLCANDIHPLPRGISLSTISRFLNPSRSITQYATQLDNLWRALQDDRMAKSSESYRELERMLLLPDVISKADIDSYKYLLGELIRGKGENLKVPDGQLRLRSPGDLFEKNELFTAAFHYYQNEMFVHPNFREFQRSLDVKTVVDFTIFRQCAQAIHNDQDLQQNDNIVARAAVVYRHYNNNLPPQFMTKKHLWKALDNIRFIPRGTVALRDITYDPTPYFTKQYPDVVSLNELFLDEHQSIIWTQRAQFSIQPTRNLIAVYPEVGVPTAQEVVAHLVVLATEVARDHPHDRTLVRDLKATYTWLQDHRMDAKWELQEYQDLPIFLNVENMASYLEPWQWRSANELVLNLTYDSQRCFKIQSALIEFRELLLAAGVRTRVDVTHDDESTLGDKRFESLRARGKLLDISLEPKFPEDDEIIDEGRLTAHAAFLAANVPHIEDGLTGGYSEISNRVYSFPGTYFGACAFLDLLYTGDIKDERSNESDDAMKLLAALLELLPVADQWGSEPLKRKLGYLITTKYLFIQPETLDMIQKSAEESSAPELVRACKDFRQKNESIIRDTRE